MAVAPPPRRWRDWSRRKRGWRDFRYAPTVGREKGGNPADGGGTPPGAKGGAMTGAKLNKIHTKFVFFKASPDESTVGVVYSFPAVTMGDGAEYPGWIPCGAKLDKTRPKFSILKFFPDERRKSPCGKTAAPKPVAPPLAPHSAGLGAGFKTGEAAGR